MYQRPYNIDKIKEKYADIAPDLLSDPIHLWRATSGIELIHKEPTPEEQKRIWENWKEMTPEQKKISDEKSLEFFGMTNEEHQSQIMSQNSL
jgi:hypothetical protein